VPGELVRGWPTSSCTPWRVVPDDSGGGWRPALIIRLEPARAARAGYIVALVAGTVVVRGGHLPLETIGIRFGGIPAGLPEIHVPRFRRRPRPDAAVADADDRHARRDRIAAVGRRRRSDERTRHNSNVELFAQGIANIVSPLVGGLPATGAIARTATNVRSGAKTPVAGIIHALTLLVILLFAAPLAASVPMAVLAAILLVVAYNMGEWREIPELWKQGWTDRIVWLWTFALTVFADLTVAVEAGMIIAALLFIRRVSATTTVSRVTPDYIRAGACTCCRTRTFPTTSPSSASMDRFSSVPRQARGGDPRGRLAPIVVLRLRNMTAIDATGLRRFRTSRMH
jgi:SulP family sulfate permease